MCFSQERLPSVQTDFDAWVLQLVPSGELRDCLNSSTHLQENMDTAGQYFYPFEMEFCLSALALLLSMTKPMAKKKTEGTYTYVYIECKV